MRQPTPRAAWKCLRSSSDAVQARNDQARKHDALTCITSSGIPASYTDRPFWHVLGSGCGTVCIGPLASAPVTAPSFNTSRSQELFSAAQALMPGGVSSPVRAFKSVGGQPIVFDRVKGPYAWDVDDNKYIDYTYTNHYYHNSYNIYN